MRATNISRISGRKKLAEYLVALFRSKSVTFWVQLVGIQYWNVAITDKETILCQVIRTYQLFLSVLLSGKDWLTWLIGTNLNNTDFWTPAFRRKGVPWFDYCQYFFFFFWLEFSPWKAEQPLRGMELQEKAAWKSWSIQEICLERNHS